MSGIKCLQCLGLKDVSEFILSDDLTMCNDCYDEAMNEAECISVMNHIKSCAKCRADIIKNGEEV